MSNHTFNQVKGAFGEDVASRYLREQGFHLVTRNYHGQHGEIDIIAVRDRVLHFVEVKNRTSNIIPGRFAVNYTKQKHLRNTAQLFLVQNPEWADYLISFDVIEITDGKIEYLENCFY